MVEIEQRNEKDPLRRVFFVYHQVSGGDAQRSLFPLQRHEDDLAVGVLLAEVVEHGILCGGASEVLTDGPDELGP
jgi:hypothetical protein